MAVFGYARVSTDGQMIGFPKPRILHPWPERRFAVKHPRWEKLWGGRRRSWHLHRPYELMEVAPWPKSMISAEA